MNKTNWLANFDPLSPKLLIKIILLAIAYIILDEISISFALNTNKEIIAVYLPTGMALAIVYWQPRGILLGVGLGQFIATLYQFGLSASGIGLALIIAIGTTLEIFIDTLLLNQYIKNQNIIENPNSVVRFIGISGIGAVISATMGITALIIFGKIDISTIIEDWRNWLVGNLCGILVLTPMLLSLLCPGKTNKNNYPKLIELMLLLLLLLIINYIVFYQGLFLQYILVPLLVWSGWRFGNKITTILMFLVNAIAIVATANHIGLFYSAWLKDASLLFLQMFIGVTAIITLLILSGIAEREAHQNSLKKAYQELQILDQLKDEFLANTSHELRTPLNGMIGLAESLLSGIGGNLSDIQKQNLLMIAQSGHRLANLVNDILDFSKLKHEHLELNITAVGIREAVEVVLNINQILIGTKPVKLINNVSSDLPPVAVDENRLQQILYNLIGNAIKFTNSGQIVVSAKLIKESNRTPKIAISVEDTGIGIAQDKLESIFKSFVQADGSITRKYGGTGLGLSITKQLVELHGGTISVTSQLDQGSCFTFTLSVMSNKVDKKESNSIEHHRYQPLLDNNINIFRTTNNSSHTNQKFTILIVDDEIVNLQVLINYLSLENYRIWTAMNGQEALKIIDEKGKPDLILLDVMMPQMTGYEVCNKLRRDFSPAELPIVILSAKNQIEDLIYGLEIGANDYLMKPINRPELLARLKTHLHLSHINRASSRFFPHEFLDFLHKDNIVDIKLGDHVAKEMTVMFSDIRSFTNISEKMTPQQNFDFVNAYLKEVSPKIRQYEGFIVKYLGDGMMAVFPCNPDQAVLAAIAKLKKVEQYNQQLVSQGWDKIKVGIGIHMGMMMVGIVGETARMQGDAFSDHVNLAARLEGLTKIYGSSLIISEDVLNKLANDYEIRFLDRVIVKGRTEPIGIYEICNGEPDQIRDQKKQTHEQFKQAILAYQAQQFEIAKNIFESILIINPDDLTSQVYLERINYFLKHGVDDNWSGVWTLSTK